MSYIILKSNNLYVFKNNLTNKKIKNKKKFIIVDQIKIIDKISQHKSLEDYVLMKIAENRFKNEGFKLNYLRVIKNSKYHKYLVY